MTTGKFDLAIAVALVPVLGTGLVLMNQLGRYFFYGVPPELLELDAYKVLVSSLSMLFLGASLLYLGATLYDSSGEQGRPRLTFHLLFAAALTGPFWANDLDWRHSVSWATVGFVGFTGSVFFGAERWLRRERVAKLQERVSGWALTVFFASLLVLAATCAHGYLAEQDRTSHTFLAATDDAVVGRVGGLLIIKTYDPKVGTFNRQLTKLVSVEEVIVLEVRSIRRH